MKPESNRLICYQRDMIFYFDEMTNLLQSDTRVPLQVCEAIIAAWINLLRFEVLQKADKDQEFLLALQNGEGTLYLKKSLIPERWTKENFGHQVARRTGVSFSTVCSTFQKMSEILKAIDGTKPFEPVGWFEVIPPKDDEAFGGFRVHLWEDFPQPASYKFETAAADLSRRLD